MSGFLFVLFFSSLFFSSLLFSSLPFSILEYTERDEKRRESAGEESQSESEEPSRGMFFLSLGLGYLSSSLALSLSLFLSSPELFFSFLFFSLFASPTKILDSISLGSGKRLLKKSKKLIAEEPEPKSTPNSLFLPVKRLFSTLTKYLRMSSEPRLHLS